MEALKVQLPSAVDISVGSPFHCVFQRRAEQCVRGESLLKQRLRIEEHEIQQHAHYSMGIT